MAKLFLCTGRWSGRGCCVSCSKLTGMQSLGLSSGTPEVEPIWKTWLWPNVADEIAAKQAARNAMYGTFFVAGMTTLFVVLQMAAVLALIDALLFVLAGIGIAKMYRTAAVLGFTLFLIEKIAMAVGGQNPLGIMSIAITLLLFTAIRATFAYHKLRKQPPELPTVGSASA